MSYNTDLQSNNEELAEILQAVNDLPEAGGGLPEGDFSDPDYVYAVTRPKDWLPMPTPGDDEVYLLNLIPEGLDGAFTALINFTRTCNVEFGNLVDGVFVAKETVTPTSGTRFFHTVYVDDYGDTTSDGYRQYLVRIKGSSITYVDLCPGDIANFVHGDFHVVDAVVGIKAQFVTGTYGTAYQNCINIRYVRFVGNGQLYNISGLCFRQCPNLLLVSSEKQATGNSMNYMFSGCSSLMALSKEVFCDNATYNYTFNSNAKFPAIKGLHLKPTQAVSLFNSTRSEKALDGNQIDTSECESLANFVANSFFSSVVNLNISSATNVVSMFKYSRLTKLTFAGETTPGGWTIDCSYCVMSQKALVNMINSLPTALSPATITITNNPGASQLTDEEIAVATAKNWTVTI